MFIPKRTQVFHYFLFGAVFALLSYFLIYPISDLFIQSFSVNGRFSLKFFELMLDNPLYIQSIINSLKLGLLVVVFTAMLSLPLALIITRTRFWGKDLWQGLLLVPLIMPPFVGAIGIKQLFARFGSINLALIKLGLVSSQNPPDWLGGSGFWGVVILETLHLYPIMYLNIVAAMANIDPSLEEMAYNLSARFHHVLRRIILPLILPGFFAGAIITFIWAFTDLGTPIILNYKETMAVQIFNMVTDIHQNQMGYTLVVFMAGLTTLLFIVSRRILGNKRYEMLARGHVTQRAKWVKPWQQFSIIIFIFGIIVLALLPHIGVIISSVAEKWLNTIVPEKVTTQYYYMIFTNPLAYISIKNSFLYSIGSVFLDLMLGVTIAFILTRTKVRGKSILDSLAMLPLSLPGLVLAFGYVATFSGTILDPRQDPTILLVISYAFRRLPYMVRSAHAGFQQSSIYLEEAARNLGARTLTIIRRITFPLIHANLIAGGLLCFAYAMLEVSDSLILAMKEQYFPITKAIYILFSYVSNGIAIACVLGVLGMIILATAITLAGKVLGQKLGELFRSA